MKYERLGFLVTDDDTEGGSKMDRVNLFLDKLAERSPDEVEYETTIYLGDDELVLVKLTYWEGDNPWLGLDPDEPVPVKLPDIKLTGGVTVADDKYVLTNDVSQTDFVDITKGVPTGEISDLFNGGFPEGLQEHKPEASFVPGGIFTPPQDMMDRALKTAPRAEVADCG